MTDETDQQQDQRPSLREIARDMHRRAQPRADRWHDTPIKDIPHEKIDRRLDLENDPYALESVTPPRFKNINELYEHRQQQKKEAEEQKFVDAERYLKAQAEEFENSVSSATTWSAPEEIAAVNEYNGRYQAHENNKAQFATALQARADHVAALRKEGREAEAQQFAAHYVREIQEAGQQLAGEADWIARRTQEGLIHQARKVQGYGRAQLARTVGPQVLDPNAQEHFFRWAEREKAIPRFNIQTETNPLLVARLFKEWVRWEEDQYRTLARERIATTVPVQRGPGSDRDSTSARQSLRKRGKMDDALNFLHLRRQEKRYGI